VAIATFETKPEPIALAEPCRFWSGAVFRRPEGVRAVPVHSRPKSSRGQI